MTDSQPRYPISVIDRLLESASSLNEVDLLSRFDPNDFEGERLSDRTEGLRDEGEGGEGTLSLFVGS